MQLKLFCFQELVLESKSKVPDWEMITKKMNTSRTAFLVSGRVYMWVGGVFLLLQEFGLCEYGLLRQHIITPDVPCTKTHYVFFKRFKKKCRQGCLFSQKVFR